MQEHLQNRDSCRTYSFSTGGGGGGIMDARVGSLESTRETCNSSFNSVAPLALVE